MSTENIPLTFVASGVTHVNCSAADLAKSGVPDSVILPPYQDMLSTKIDNDAEAARSSLMTPGFGQVMEYQEAQTQAFAALASPGDATPAKYPMLAATIGIDVDPTTKAPATDVVGVARAISAAFSAWLAFGSAIKAARMKGKAGVSKATTVADATAAYAAVTWPSAT